jgi:hypothetical protein
VVGAAPGKVKLVRRGRGPARSPGVYITDTGQSLASGTLTGAPSEEAPQGLAAIHEELNALRDALESFDSAPIFSLDSDTYPFELTDVLRGIQTHFWALEHGEPPTHVHLMQPARQIFERAQSLFALMALTTDAKTKKVRGIKDRIPEGYIKARLAGKK